MGTKQKDFEESQTRKEKHEQASNTIWNSEQLHMQINTLITAPELDQILLTYLLTYLLLGAESFLRS